MAYLIEIEGKCDGNGKATQVKEVTRLLKERGYRVVNLTSPNYSLDSGKTVKRFLSGDFVDPLTFSPLASSLLYTVNRFEDFNTNWKYLYGQNDLVIILDRWTTSNLIYQTAKEDDLMKRVLLLEEIEEIEFKEFNLPKPNLTIVLDKGLDECIKSLQQRDDLDAHESSREFLERVYQNASWVAEYKKFFVFDMRDESNQVRPIEKNAEILASKIMLHLAVEGIKPIMHWEGAFS